MRIASGVLGLVMGILAGSMPAQASPAGQNAPGAGQQAGAALQALRQRSCPPGIESFVPGSYYYCVGVRELARDRFGQGVEMLKIAAAWGSKPAQFLLGVGYYKGDTVPMDRAQGLAWLALAAERGDPTYAAVLASARQRATADERQRAEALR